jgi:hypothetical protein
MNTLFWGLVFSFSPLKMPDALNQTIDVTTYPFDVAAQVDEASEDGELILYPFVTLAEIGEKIVAFSTFYDDPTTHKTGFACFYESSKLLVDGVSMAFTPANLQEQLELGNSIQRNNPSKSEPSSSKLRLDNARVQILANYGDCQISVLNVRP